MQGSTHITAHRRGTTLSGGVPIVARGAAFIHRRRDTCPIQWCAHRASTHGPRAPPAVPAGTQGRTVNLNAPRGDEAISISAGRS